MAVLRSRGAGGRVNARCVRHWNRHQLDRRENEGSIAYDASPKAPLPAPDFYGGHRWPPCHDDAAAVGEAAATPCRAWRTRQVHRSRFNFCPANTHSRQHGERSGLQSTPTGPFPTTRIWTRYLLRSGNDNLGRSSRLASDLDSCLSPRGRPGRIPLIRERGSRHFPILDKILRVSQPGLIPESTSRNVP